MDQTETKGPVTVTREELYRQVWETPMARLGEQYGVTGNGLKKICDRLNVPYPQRGYWAKQRFGKRVKQVPLPHAGADAPQEVTITPTPPPPPKATLDPALAEKLARVLTDSSGISAPKTLRNPHPSIAAWIADHGRQIEESRRNRLRRGGGFETKPLTALERREQRILSTLYKELEKRGFRIRGQAPYSVSVESGRDKVEFTLRERIRQVRRPLNDKEKADSFYKNQQWRHESFATGELVFTLKTLLAAGRGHQWRDGERPLEEQIGEIVAVLSLAGPILSERMRRAEEAERRRWEEERKRAEEQERQQLESNRWRRLLELAEAWEQSHLAARFICELEKLAPDTEYSYGGRTSAEWLAWARERREANDPTRWPIGGVCLKLAEVNSWQYRQ